MTHTSAMRSYCTHGIMTMLLVSSFVFATLQSAQACGDGQIITNALTKTKAEETDVRQQHIANGPPAVQLSSFGAPGNAMPNLAAMGQADQLNIFYNPVSNPTISSSLGPFSSMFTSLLGSAFKAISGGIMAGLSGLAGGGATTGCPAQGTTPGEIRVGT